MSLEGFGYLSPQRERRDVLGVQWCSSIFPDRAPAGTVLLRALCGGWNRPEIVDWDDDRLLTAVRGELRQAMGVTAAPVFHQIVAGTKAIPQYHLGHLERVGLDRRAGWRGIRACSSAATPIAAWRSTIAWNRRVWWRNGWRVSSPNHLSHKMKRAWLIQDAEPFVGVAVSRFQRFQANDAATGPHEPTRS